MAKYTIDLSIVKPDSGPRYYSTGILENVVEPTFPTTIEARVGDRWDTIAYLYLGNAKLWYKVAALNGGANGSIFIKPGTIITIPQ